MGVADVSDNGYFRLKANSLARENEDLFTELCFEQGASGVAEDLAFVQRDLRYDPDVLETPTLDVNVYFESTPSESVLISIQARFPEVRLELFNEENKDWLAEWKKGFKPFPFPSPKSGPFWVIPSWLTPPPEAPKDSKYLIYVEPGMAFGTGTHETTRLASQLIIEELGRAPAHSLIDVGTGTGILALVAHRLGVEHLIGIDNDPEARRTARENLERNHDFDIQIPECNIEDVHESFDVVVANIIDGVLLLLKDELVRVLRPGGRMILSGILMDRETEFYDTFTRETGLELVKKISEGEWSAACLERPRA